MRYLTEFRDGDAARAVARQIAYESDPTRSYRLMEFCGGHTHAIFRYGLPDVLPKNIQLIHGPGCPVCVLPAGRLAMAIDLAKRPNTVLCSYGDLLRVPGSHRQSLLQAKSQGAEVEVVYSPADAVALAAQQPERTVVFMAIGFETTAPATAAALATAQARGLTNFLVFCNHILTPPALGHLLNTATDGGADSIDEPSLAIDGILGPSHVSVIIGSDAYQFAARQFHKPIVIAGFEPLDVLHSILLLVRQLNAGEARVENQYARAVTPEGNATAQALMARCFAPRPTFEWRGLGDIPHSALTLSDDFQAFDAERRLALAPQRGQDHKACECPAILRGVKSPTDCKLFATACTPDNPLGACMVSDEGACAAHYKYRRLPLSVAS